MGTRRASNQHPQSLDCSAASPSTHLSVWHAGGAQNSGEMGEHFHYIPWSAKPSASLLPTLGEPTAQSPPARTATQRSPTDQTPLLQETTHSFSEEITWIWTGLLPRGERVGRPCHFGIIFWGGGSVPSKKRGPGARACRGQDGLGLGWGAPRKKARDGTDSSAGGEACAQGRPFLQRQGPQAPLPAVSGKPLLGSKRCFLGLLGLPCNRGGLGTQ